MKLRIALLAALTASSVAAAQDRDHPGGDRGYGRDRPVAEGRGAPQSPPAGPAPRDAYNGGAPVRPTGPSPQQAPQQAPPQNSPWSRNSGGPAQALPNAPPIGQPGQRFSNDTGGAHGDARAQRDWGQQDYGQRDWGRRGAPGGERDWGQGRFPRDQGGPDRNGPDRNGQDRNGQGRFDPGRRDYGRDNRRDWDGQHQWRYRGGEYHSFHVSPFAYPRGWGYRRWGYGERLPWIFLSQTYWIGDFYNYDLPPAPYDCRWVRYGPDALLVNVYTGEVEDVIYGIFYW